MLFTIQSGGPAPDATHITVLNLDTGEHTELVSAATNPRYAATGHVVYGTAGGLRAVPFDLDRLEVTGDPVLVVEGVRTEGSGGVNFGLAANGSLVYVSDPEQDAVMRTLVWVDRHGREDPLSAEPRAYVHPRISPDGTRVALEIRDQENDICIWNLAAETLTRLTVYPASDHDPTWTPDSRRVLFGSLREGRTQVFARAADGTGPVERLTDSTRGLTPYVVSPDGAQVVMRASGPATADLVRMALEGDRSVEDLLASAFAERNADLSPDGRWMAYESNESGQPEVYVRPFPDVDLELANGQSRRLGASGLRGVPMGASCSTCLLWGS